MQKFVVTTKQYILEWNKKRLGGKTLQEMSLFDYYSNLLQIFLAASSSLFWMHPPNNMHFSILIL